jgi:hypothetical protein
LIEHMLFFSFVEAVVTALAFGYIARFDPTIIFNYKARGDQKRDAVPAAPSEIEV